MSLASVFEAGSVSLHGYRRWFIGGPVLVWVLLIIAHAQPWVAAPVLRAISAFVFGAATISFGLATMIGLFHPQSGSLRPRTDTSTLLPAHLRSTLRDWAAIFLVIWFAIGVAIVPLIMDLVPALAV